MMARGKKGAEQIKRDIFLSSSEPSCERIKERSFTPRDMHVTLKADDENRNEFRASVREILSETQYPSVTC